MYTKSAVMIPVLKTACASYCRHRVPSRVVSTSIRVGSMPDANINDAISGASRRGLHDLCSSSSSSSIGDVGGSLFRRPVGSAAGVRSLSTTSDDGIMTSSAAERPVKATGAMMSDCAEYLKIDWNDGDKSEYPWVWLRDNCQCPACFQPTAKARLSLLENLDIHCRPSAVTLSKPDQIVRISWSDGHQSALSGKWLYDRSFSRKQQQARASWYKTSRIPWAPGFDASGIERFDFDEVMSEDRSLLDFLETLEVRGLVLIRGAPLEEGVVKRIADRIAFLRTTNYGKEFTVKAKLNPSSAGYTNAKLGFHADLVHYNHMPGVEFLHCIEQAKGNGGETLFTDGLAAAGSVERRNPECYLTLTTVPVDFHDVGVESFEFFTLQRRPVVELDADGEIYRINHNNGNRDSFLNVRLDQVKPVYRALKLFDDELRKTAVTMKLREGDVAVFDNTRILHGRNAFDSKETSISRHLQGGYTDWDEVRSRIRVLRTKLEQLQN